MKGSDPRLCSGHAGKHIRKALAAKRKSEAAAVDFDIATTNAWDVEAEGNEDYLDLTHKQTAEAMKESHERRLRDLAGPVRTERDVLQDMFWIRSYIPPWHPEPRGAIFDEKGDPYVWKREHQDILIERARTDIGVEDGEVRDRAWERSRPKQPRTPQERASSMLRRGHDPRLPYIPVDEELAPIPVDLDTPGGADIRAVGIIVEEARRM